jgi:ribonuclease HII
MLIAGIDEAGRGPAIGPMVIAIACISKEREEELLKIGVKDSKMLTRSARESQLADFRELLDDCHTVHISACEIDDLRKRNSLNEIETMRSGELVGKLKNRANVVYIDCPDPIPQIFIDRLNKYLPYKPMLKVEHKADVNYPIVSAASILAKVERDLAITELEEKLGAKIGTGYPHDPDTIKFLNACIKENKGKNLPDYVRKSWMTTQTMVDAHFQRKLTDIFSEKH